MIDRTISVWYNGSMDGKPDLNRIGTVTVEEGTTPRGAAWVIAVAFIIFGIAIIVVIFR
jgi:hypothetical protein